MGPDREQNLRLIGEIAMPFFANLTTCAQKEQDSTWVTSAADPGSKECVVAVKALAHAPKTSFWRRGQKVKGNSIAPGTAIATFPRVHADGHLEFKGHGAIYISQTTGGIYVYDQWNTKRFGRRFIRFKCDGYVSDDGDAFYVIELTELPSSDPAMCGPGSSYTV